jgi:hypothetical protein
MSYSDSLNSLVETRRGAFESTFPMMFSFCLAIHFILFAGSAVFSRIGMAKGILRPFRGLVSLFIAIDHIDHWLLHNFHCHALWRMTSHGVAR